jgi:LysM repeat protein
MRKYILLVIGLLPLLIFAQQHQEVDKNGKKYLLHTVQKGEGALAIARKYDVTVDDIVAANNVNIEKLQRNQVLRIPIKETIPNSVSQTVKPDSSSIIAVHANAQESKSTIKYNIIHTVQRGENLNVIAQRYETTVTDIQKWNKLSSTKIEVGQELRIKPFVNNTPYKPWNMPTLLPLITTNILTQQLVCEAYMNIEWVEGNQFVLNRKVGSNIILVEPIYEVGMSKLITNFIIDESLQSNAIRVGIQLAKQLNLQPNETRSLIIKYIE